MSTQLVDPSGPIYTRMYYLKPTLNVVSKQIDILMESEINKNTYSIHDLGLFHNEQ